MSLLHIAGGATEDKLDASDVFSAYVRVGTGADVTVTTGIDYTKGFMSWTKGRSGATGHAIYDSARGVTKDLVTNSTAAQTTQTTGLKSVSTTGHTIGSLAKMNTSGATYVDWVFKKAPKFFDIVTYTGDGVAGRQIPHNLGCEVGMIVVKRADTISDWAVYQRSVGGTAFLKLNLTDAQATSSGVWNNTEPTTSVFTVGNFGMVNASGATYVAYLFAHDPSADGIIQCGSYVGNGSTNGPEINLGWEPQYVLAKSASFAADWQLVDSMRGMVVGSGDMQLLANSSNSESNLGDAINPLSTGFKVTTSGTSFNESGQTYIYLAIRRPMKVPTSGTEVYNAIARTGTDTDVSSVGNIGFPSDLSIISDRSKAVAYGASFMDRLRGNNSYIDSAKTDSEGSISNLIKFDYMTTVGLLGTLRVNGTSYPYINHFFKRAKGFMDIVCYTGTGVARTVNHNLGVVPELMIVKSRSNDDGVWGVYHAANTATYKMSLNAASAKYPAGSWNNTTPTATVFSLGGAGEAVNTINYTYVTYLFATLQGISKVGSYTGNGTSQTIPCGFSTGARFVLIKRTDSTGDWYIWDTARGIVAANDPHLSLNTTSAEVTTDDSIDPASSGFIVNQNTATNINVNLATYIYFSVS